jgi:hypothetical protein
VSLWAWSLSRGRLVPVEAVELLRFGELPERLLSSLFVQVGQVVDAERDLGLVLDELQRL